MRIETKSGFTADLDESFRDDWEFVEALDMFMEGRAGSMVRLAKKLLDTKTYNALKEHCREDGKVSATRMTDEILEILTSAGKNS